MSDQSHQASISFLLERVLRHEAYESRIQNLEAQNCQLLKINQKLEEDFKVLAIKFDELYQAQLGTKENISRESERSVNNRSTKYPDSDEIVIIDQDYFETDSLDEIKPGFKNSNDETIIIQEPSLSKKVPPQNLEKEKSSKSNLISSTGEKSQIKGKGQLASNSERSQKRAANRPTGENYLNKKIKVESKEKINYPVIQPGVQPHVCLISKSTFPTLAHTKTHYQVGNRTRKIILKPYKCDICNAAFPNSDDLKIHLRTHRAPELYRCSFCLKRFYQVGDLNRHKQSTHTNYKDAQTPLART